jgi:hypothetical protein
MQFATPGQGKQSCPKLPQSEPFWTGKVKHWDPAQQPLGQVDGLQEGPASKPTKVHCPSWQTPLGHTRHWPPLPPHDAGVSPDSQTPALSQQPEQVVKLHGAVCDEQASGAARSSANVPAFMPRALLLEAARGSI